MTPAGGCAENSTCKALDMLYTARQTCHTIFMSTTADDSISYSPHRLKSAAGGFGVTLPLLEHNAPAKHPWLTPAIARQEMDITEYAFDRVTAFLDSVPAAEPEAEPA